MDGWLAGWMIGVSATKSIVVVAMNLTSYYLAAAAVQIFLVFFFFNIFVVKVMLMIEN